MLQRDRIDILVEYERSGQCQTKDCESFCAKGEGYDFECVPIWETIFFKRERSREETKPTYEIMRGEYATAYAALYKTTGHHMRLDQHNTTQGTTHR